MKVLMIDIDTLRPDHMSCYGYGRQTTPHMDKVAAEGMRFTNYYCSDAPCLPSRAALVTGMFGIHNGAVGHGGTAADVRLCGEKRSFHSPVDDGNLHNIFRRAGFHTASVSTFAERHSAFWFLAGFHESINVGFGGMESGELVLPEALSWLERNKDRENWFLHIHLWDPHTPYRAPAFFGEPFAESPLPDPWIDEAVLEQHLSHTGPHSINEINMYNDATSPQYPRQLGKGETLSDVKKILDGYDTGILYADHLVGQVLETLRQQGVYEDTAVIITSDHGETIGELGIYSEHGTADYATCRIPMIIRWPGCASGVDEGLHYNIDLCPTLAELLGVKKAPHWDGSSFAPVLKEGADCGRELLVLSQMAHVCQRSVRWGEYLYMRTYHDGFHLFPKEMLFNIAEDPHEQNNLAQEQRELCDYAAARLLDWQDEMLQDGTVTDPLWTVLREGGPFHSHISLLPAYLERLEKTGRSEGATRLREEYKNYPRELLGAGSKEEK